MADGLLQRLPNLEPLLQASASTEGGINALVGTFNSLGHDRAGSPLASVTQVLGNLDSHLDIDVSGLSTQLPTTIRTIQNAIPPDTLAYVKAIEEAYRSTQNFLNNTPLAKAVQEGSSLQAVAMAVIEEALSLFNSRLAGLTGNLIPSQRLEQIKSIFAAVDAFQANFPAQQAEFLPFISQNLVGVSPELLRRPLEHLNTAYAVLAPLEPDALSTTLDPARQAIANAFISLVTTIESLDPTDASAYVQIQTRLSGLEAAINTMLGTLTPLYQQMDTLIASHPWNTIFSTYRTLLDALTFDNVLSVDRVIDSIAGTLNELLARTYMLFGADDLTERIGRLSQTVRDMFSNSGLGQIRQTLRDFLGQIRTAIESVPTEAIQTTVETMLARVKQELDNLGITQIADEIEQAFNQAETWLVDNLNDTLTNNVRTAVSQVFNQVKNLPVASFIADITTAVGELDSVISDLEQALAGYMDDFAKFVSQLDQLSFKPLSNEVIGEIDELKKRLQAINPNALSDAEKLAIKGALSVLEAIDLENQAIAGLKAGFAEAQNGVKSLLGEITGAMERLRDNLGGFNPDSLLEPVNGLLNQVAALVERLNGKVLLKPLYGQVNDFRKRLEAIAPGRLLDPLQEPYNAMIEVVNQLDPTQWVAPLHDLYAQIDRLISYVDITPVLDELDRRQKELFATARNAILSGLDGLNLPEPLNSFFGSLRPVLEGMTDAIFGNPDQQLKQLSVNLRTQFNLSSLFQPLDEAFDRLVAMIDAIPQDALTDTMNTIRQTLGVGLEVLEPRAIISRLRQGQSQLAELAPTILLGIASGLPSLKASFQAKVAVAPPERLGDVATVSARFDAVLLVVEPNRAESQFGQLRQTHQQLLNSLRLKINNLDVSAAQVAYARLRDNLNELLPDFLRQVQPLTYSDILAGIYALRPSAKATKVDQLLEQFLQQLAPMEAAVEPAINGFFASLRETVMLINPLSLKDAVKDIYDTLRAKVRILEPDALADSIRVNFFAPLTEPLQAINPATIKLKINAAFNRVLDVLSTNVKKILDDIVLVIDEQFRAIHREIQLLLSQIKEAIKTVFASIKKIVDRVEQLIFVELLERLNRLIDNLGVSFEQELDRVRNAFDAMLAAIPLSSSSASTSLSTG